MTSISSSIISSTKLPSAVATLHTSHNSNSAFAEMLNPNHATSSSGMSVKQAAEKLVSSALLMPIIQQLHGEHTFRAGMFKAGDAERRFQPIMDYYLADQVASGANFDLTEAVIERLQPQLNSRGS